MTFDSTRLGPPPTFFGAALWFGRNFLEALIWASAGAMVLVLVLIAQRHPVMIIGLAALLVIIGAAAWSVVKARRSRTSTPRAGILRFHVFRVPIKVIVGSPRDPQGDRR